MSNKDKRKIKYTRWGFGVDSVSREAIKRNLKSLLQIIKQGKEKEKGDE